MNCAVCHAGSVRATPESQRQIVLGMPSNTVDFRRTSGFCSRAPAIAAFTVDAVMERIRAQGGLDWYERVAYPRAVRQFREQVLAQRRKWTYWDDPSSRRFGPGRIDTFNPYKVLGFDMGVGRRGSVPTTSRRCGTSGRARG